MWVQRKRNIVRTHPEREVIIIDGLILANAH